MKAMKEFPDNFFELAIVDPPYGIGSFWAGGDTKKKDYRKNETDWNNNTPTKEYWDELKRVSKNQIVWGWNYYTEYLGNSDSLIIWIKDQSAPNYSHAEIAYSSFKHKIKYFRLSLLRHLEKRGDHPCSKPYNLYDWLLRNYAKDGDKILDTHLGSGSSAIAAHRLGFEFWGYEIDKDYYDAAVKRINLEKTKLTMF
jgi:site-specific DNA-methyltransferase (adenine-specific)